MTYVVEEQTERLSSKEASTHNMKRYHPAANAPLLVTSLVLAAIAACGNTNTSFFAQAADEEPDENVVLNHELMQLTKTAAELSALAYREKPNATSIPNVEYIHFYDQEPDQALVVKTTDGYCFGAFRGTTLTWEDWYVCSMQQWGGERRPCCFCWCLLFLVSSLC